MDLEYEIAHCRNVCAWFTDPKKPNPCSRIIESQGLPQNAEALERFQLPEPWQGHLDRALILFVSSNPSIDPRITKPYPYWSLPHEQMRNCYDNSFDHEGGWIINGKQFMAPDGQLNTQRYWASVKNRASEILQKDADQGIDYALTEVVHCKSYREEGVRSALDTCAQLYLKRVVELSQARLIVVLGRTIQAVVRKELALDEDVAVRWGLQGPVDIGGRQRYVAFLGHPSGPDPKTFKKCIPDRERRKELRAFLRAEAVNTTMQA